MLVKNTGIESSRKKTKVWSGNRLLGDHTRGMVDHRPTPVSVRPAWVRSTERPSFSSSSSTLIIPLFKENKY
jgi:hypothetical protein